MKYDLETVKDLPVFLINMRLRPDRLLEVRRNIKTMEWRGPIIRVEASTIDIRTPEFAAFKDMIVKGDDHVKKKVKITDRTYAGLIGCSLSHIHVMELAQEFNLDAFMVMEDDAISSPLWGKVDNWPGDPELVIFGRQNYNYRARKHTIGWWRNPETAWGTHAYAVLTPGVRDALLAEWRKMAESIDKCWVNVFGEHETVVHEPALIYQSGSRSNISDQ